MGLRPCLRARCPNLVQGGGYCDEHGRPDTDRPSSARRGYDKAWRQAAAAYLRDEAAREGRPTPSCRIKSPHCLHNASMVDHVKAHKGDRARFWDRTNWQPACVPCNTWKANREEGGFGNPRKRSVT